MRISDWSSVVCSSDLCWRLSRARSPRWLINANAIAALAVLVAASVIDLSAVAATWNVRHARTVGDAAGSLDLCYLRTRGASALLPLIDLERRVKRSEEHTSELQSLMRISYPDFCLTK